MIDQIKKDHAIVTSGEHARNLAEVEYRVEAERKMTGYVAYLLDELEKERRGKEVALSSHKYLEGELEKANKALDAKFIFWSNGQDEESYANQEKMLQLEQEHTAMKEALEWVRDCREDLPEYPEQHEFAEAFFRAEDKSKYVLSKLQCID